MRESARSQKLAVKIIVSLLSARRQLRINSSPFGRGLPLVKAPAIVRGKFKCLAARARKYF